MKAQQFPHSLYYLTEKLPRRLGYAEMLVTILRKKGLKSKAGRPYTATIIYNVVRGMHNDDNVKQALEALVTVYGREEPVEADTVN